MDPKKKFKKCGKNKTIRDEVSLKKKLKQILRCNNTNTLRDILDLPDDVDHSSYENNYTSPLLEKDIFEEERKKPESLITLKKTSKSGKTAKPKEMLKKHIKVDSHAEEIESCAIKSEEAHKEESEMMNIISEIVASSPTNKITESHPSLTETSMLTMESSTTPHSSIDKKKLKKKKKKKSLKQSKLIEDVLVPMQLNFEPSDKKKKENESMPKRKHGEDQSIDSVKVKKSGIGISDTKVISSDMKMDKSFSEHSINDVTISYTTGNSGHLSDFEEILSSYSDNSDDFDVNRSLAGRIIKKIESKKNVTADLKNNHQKEKASKTFKDDNVAYENILNKYKYSIQFPPKLEQNIDYVSSVLEVFSGNSHRETSATISMATLQNEYDSESDAGSLLDKSGVTDDLDVEKETEFSPEKNIESIMDQSDEVEGVNSIILFTISNFCIAILKANTKTYFCGKLKVSVLKGSVEVLGHKLTEKQCELYSLSISSLYSFNTTSGGKKKSLNFKSKLVGLGISDSTIEDILEQVSNDDSVIVLRPHNNIMTDFIKKHFTTSSIFYCGKLKETDPGNHEANKLLDCKFYSEVHPGVLSMGETWPKVAQDLASMRSSSRPNSVLICGGKNSGKSTFLRYLVNTTLENGPVLVIDLDPGQPEFTVGGVISATIVREPLLGPNFTHLKQPDRCLCLGLLNVSENQERYFASVKDLVNYCSTAKKYAKMPWIINTMGFGGNLGIQLMANIMSIIRPKIVVELICQMSRNNFDMELNASNLNSYQENTKPGKQSPHSLLDHIYYRLDPFQSQWDLGKTALNKNLEAKSERLLNVLAYFSQISTAKSLSVLEMIPYAIPMAAVDLAMNNIIGDHSYVASILNGRIVALCSAQYSNTPQNKIYKLGTVPTVCHGYGIIRGIDCVEKMLYVLTPIEPCLLASVNTLVYAESLPDCHLLSIHTLPPNTRVPYTTPIADEMEHRHLMKTPKRKFNPFRLLEIKRRA